MPEEYTKVPAEELQRRRKWFEDDSRTIDWLTPPDFTAPLQQYTCPCCGYPTLTQRGGFEMCPLDAWEDDDQDDFDADEVRGGPNADYSLTQARENFRAFWTMYEPNRYSFPESPVVVAAKREVAGAFDAMRATSSERTRRFLLLIVRKNLDVLRSESERRAVEFEAGVVENARP